ncbi:hypothetical protein [Pseudomonas sp.]|uniref:hypothetical protein n=1 Tax=Pseudomonas sp. TaxID=306 RepID=UPI003D133B18
MSEAALFGIRQGGQARYRLRFPGLDDKYYVELRPPTLEEKRRLQSAGLIFRQGTEDVRLNAWEAVLERLLVQVTDYVLPEYDESGQIVGEKRYSPQNGGRNDHNRLTYAALSDAALEVILGAALEIAGETDASVELYERLKAEHGPLLERMPPQER